MLYARFHLLPAFSPFGPLACHGEGLAKLESLNEIEQIRHGGLDLRHQTLPTSKHQPVQLNCLCFHGLLENMPSIAFGDPATPVIHN